GYVGIAMSVDHQEIELGNVDQLWAWSGPVQPVDLDPPFGRDCCHAGTPRPSGSAALAPCFTVPMHVAEQPWARRARLTHLFTPTAFGVGVNRCESSGAQYALRRRCGVGGRNS